VRGVNVRNMGMCGIEVQRWACIKHDFSSTVNDSHANKGRKNIILFFTD
jgi:hypothetical protein